MLLGLAFPGVLWLFTRGVALTPASSLQLYLLVKLFNWHVPAWPSGELYFNPLTWQVLFVFGAWNAYDGLAGRGQSFGRARRWGWRCSISLSVLRSR